MRRIVALVKQLPAESALNRGKVWSRTDELLALLLERVAGVEIQDPARAAARSQQNVVRDPRAIARIFATGR